MTDWQPIETAPLGASGDPETHFIGAMLDKHPNAKGRIITATCYRNKHGVFEFWGGGIIPTHWMPRPKLPGVDQ